MKLSRPALAALLLAVSPWLWAQSVFSDGFESLPSQQPEEYNCAVEGVMPSQWSAFYSQWNQTFSSPDGSPQAFYPDSVSFPTPVGAGKGQIRIVSFVPNPQQMVNMFWDRAQSRISEGYHPARPAEGMWFAISPCAGDMRPPNYFGEPFLRPGCRVFGLSASLIWTTADSVLESDSTICKLQAGKTYYMTISPTNVLDGLQTGEHTCGEGDLACDVGVVTSPAGAN